MPVSTFLSRIKALKGIVKGVAIVLGICLILAILGGNFFSVKNFCFEFNNFFVNWYFLTFKVAYFFFDFGNFGTVNSIVFDSNVVKSDYIAIVTNTRRCACWKRRRRNPRRNRSWKRGGLKQCWKHKHKKLSLGQWKNLTHTITKKNCISAKIMVSGLFLIFCNSFFIYSLLFFLTAIYAMLAVDKTFNDFAKRSALISWIQRPLG